MRASILGVLGGALLAVGCGDDLGEGLDACKAPTLSDMTLAVDVDGIEVRAVRGSGNQAGADGLYGQTCAETACSAAVPATGAQRPGWIAGGPPGCTYTPIA